MVNVVSLMHRTLIPTTATSTTPKLACLAESAMDAEESNRQTELLAANCDADMTEEQPL